MRNTKYQSGNKSSQNNKASVCQQRSKSVLEDNRTQAPQLKADSDEPIQRNDTGLPDNLKSGMENLSGKNLDHVKVHYNSTKPAAVQAHAYAQGSDIHLSSGQEQHLPHELGHVVQQMEGRVKPTMTVGDTPVNDNSSLEHEATMMGQRAIQRAMKTGQGPYLKASPPAPGGLNFDGTAQFKSMDGMGMEGVNYAMMSQDSYAQWQQTVQAKSISGVCHQGDRVFVTQLRNQADVRQLKFSANLRGGLLITEGVLTLAAGIAAVLITHGIGLIPGIAAISVGVAKIVRGIVTIKAGEEPTAKQKAVIHALRTFEAAAAIVGATAAGLNIAGLVFGVAKALRSLLMILADFINKDNSPFIHKGVTRMAAALHVVEVGAGIAAGVGLVEGAAAATTTMTMGAKIAGATGTIGTAVSKAFRAGDQNINAWKGSSSGGPDTGGPIPTTPLISNK